MTNGSHCVGHYEQATGQWEQVDLCWYLDDSNMVKLGQEMVDGKLSIVMGREQADRARTVKMSEVAIAVQASRRPR